MAEKIWWLEKKEAEGVDCKSRWANEPEVNKLWKGNLDTIRQIAGYFVFYPEHYNCKILEVFLVAEIRVKVS